MNSKLSEQLKICIEIDHHTILEFHQTINEESILACATSIEKILIDNHAKPEKIQDVYELTVEMMQNMLAYSYNSIEVKKDKMETEGCFTVSYLSSKDNYILSSCNLIEAQHENIIRQKLDELKGLDNKALRKLSREKMRSKKDNHDKGAGLGFLMMAKKSTSPIKVEFKIIGEGVKSCLFKLQV